MSPRVAMVPVVLANIAARSSSSVLAPHSAMSPADHSTLPTADGVSHASPRPLPSESRWSVLASSGQLSSGSATPSPSRSPSEIDVVVVFPSVVGGPEVSESLVIGSVVVGTEVGVVASTVVDTGGDVVAVEGEPPASRAAASSPSALAWPSDKLALSGLVVASVGTPQAAAASADAPHRIIAKYHFRPPPVAMRRE